MRDDIRARRVRQAGGEIARSLRIRFLPQTDTDRHRQRVFWKSVSVCVSLWLVCSLRRGLGCRYTLSHEYGKHGYSFAADSVVCECNGGENADAGGWECGGAGGGAGGG